VDSSCLGEISTFNVNRANEILDQIDKHFQGDCAGQTSQGIIITDIWIPGFYEKYLSRLRRIIANGVNLEIYVVGYGGWATEIRI